MTCKMMKNLDYEITLNRKEAEALAYYSCCYNDLLDALSFFATADQFKIYGSKFKVASDLQKALAARA